MLKLISIQEALKQRPSLSCQTLFLLWLKPPRLSQVSNNLQAWKLVLWNRNRSEPELFAFYEPEPDVDRVPK
jgi:hypothetical protein